MVLIPVPLLFFDAAFFVFMGKEPFTDHQRTEDAVASVLKPQRLDLQGSPS
jgi:hypothetical protein